MFQRFFPPPFRAKSAKGELGEEGEVPSPQVLPSRASSPHRSAPCLPRESSEKKVKFHPLKFFLPELLPRHPLAACVPKESSEKKAWCHMLRLFIPSHLSPHPFAPCLPRESSERKVDCHPRLGPDVEDLPKKTAELIGDSSGDVCEGLTVAVEDMQVELSRLPSYGESSYEKSIPLELLRDIEDSACFLAEVCRGILRPTTSPPVRVEEAVELKAGDEMAAADALELSSLIQWNLSYETSDSVMEVGYPSVVCALPAANNPSLHSTGLHVSPFFERVSSACQGLVLRATWRRGISMSGKNFDKYHEPYKDKTDSPIGKCIEVKIVDHILPEAYTKKTPFPAKMKEYSVITSVVNKSAKKPIEPKEHINVEPAIAIVKDLVTENVEDGHIIFCEDASNIVSHPSKSRKASVPMLSVRIGDHFYYGLCDIGASISAIPYELYKEIMHEIGSCELEDIDVVIRLANRETISPIGIVRDVEVLCGKIKYHADFLVLGSAASKTCPIIFGRPFLNTCGAIMDCKKEKIVTKFAGESYEFNFSKFAKVPYKAELPNNDLRVEQLASIALAPSNPLQQHLEDHESEVFREERNELDEIFLRQPILKHDLPVEDLGTTPPPKEDHVFDLKPLPDNLKYAYIDDKKTYHVIISAKLSNFEEERLLEILKKHRGAIGYTLDDLKGISPSICQHAINMEDDAKPVVEHQRRLIPKMKDVVRNEVLKLLEAGIIYPIADSRWVSPVHCVPKKGGITVVPNDNDELIPQRVVVGRMPFGLCNAPATFQRCMSAIFHGFCEKIVERCEETNLVLNREKCHFMVNEGIVLGHKISERGIEVDRAKVEAIEKMPYPRDVKGIRSILGHAGFYRRFIKDFSKISKPLTNLLQKDVPFVFDDDCKEAFETLKKALTTAPIVEPPDWNLPFEIMCDASDFAVG
ncbi:hypothetical protein QYE76_018584, partial [Lolium multiflorum]